MPSETYWDREEELALEEFEKQLEAALQVKDSDPDVGFRPKGFESLEKVDTDTNGIDNTTEISNVGDKGDDELTASGVANNVAEPAREKKRTSVPSQSDDASQARHGTTKVKKASVVRFAAAESVETEKQQTEGNSGPDNLSALASKLPYADQLTKSTAKETNVSSLQTKSGNSSSSSSTNRHRTITNNIADPLEKSKDGKASAKTKNEGIVPAFGATEIIPDDEADMELVKEIPEEDTDGIDRSVLRNSF